MKFTFSVHSTLTTRKIAFLYVKYIILKVSTLNIHSSTSFANHVTLCLKRVEKVLEVDVKQYRSTIEIRILDPLR